MVLKYGDCPVEITFNTRLSLRNSLGAPSIISWKNRGIFLEEESMNKYLAELIGTFVLVFASCGAAAERARESEQAERRH